MAEGSPTVRRRELGALLRRLREERGMSVKQVTDYRYCARPARSAASRPASAALPCAMSGTSAICTT